MNDATLWINDMNETVVVKNGSAIHVLPLWVFDVMRDIIVTEAEKKVDVTHRDFDIQQELLDRYRAENARLRELMSVMAYCIQGWRECDGCRVNGGDGIITERAGCYVLLDRLRELGVEVTP